MYRTLDPIEWGSSILRSGEDEAVSKGERDAELKDIEKGRAAAQGGGGGGGDPSGLIVPRERVFNLSSVWPDMVGLKFTNAHYLSGFTLFLEGTKTSDDPVITDADSVYNEEFFQVIFADKYIFYSDVTCAPSVRFGTVPSGGILITQKFGPQTAGQANSWPNNGWLADVRYDTGVKIFTKAHPFKYAIRIIPGDQLTGKAAQVEVKVDGIVKANYAMESAYQFYKDRIEYAFIFGEVALTVSRSGVVVVYR